MTLAVLNAQTVVDAVGLGAVYALMALGIGLVFGVLRLINFAYGQLVMAGAYTLALTSERGWSPLPSIALCVVVVVALALAMDRLVFRPLRTHSPATMLVATFAVAFLLQSVALLKFGALGKPVASIASLNQPVTVAGTDVRKITLIAIAVSLVALAALVVLLRRTNVGLHIRAAAADFQTARLLGVRANRVITFAVLLSGLLAAAAAVILTVQTPFVTPDFALRDTIIVLVGVVVGGIDRLGPATLGGFAIGFATGLVGGALPTDKSVYLPSVIFAAVILVLLLRPAGLFTRRRVSVVDRV